LGRSFAEGILTLVLRRRKSWLALDQTYQAQPMHFGTAGDQVPATTSHTIAILQCVSLVLVANGAPVLFERLLGKHFAGPIDAGIVLRDGHPLLGRSKTWRGVAAAILLTVFAAVLIGLPWQAGALTAVCAMAGDCISSFVKRRLGLRASSIALGLDQVPEALFPAVACAAYLPLGPIDVFAIVFVFTIGHLAISRLVRERPY
jgi:CDP-diglyceride synthetase